MNKSLDFAVSRNQLFCKNDERNIEVWVKREDELHPFISGNKFRKLKYNILAAQQQSFSTLLTFGGAYSNHIAAVSYLGKLFDIQTIGVIRGEELADNFTDNPTLKFAQENGMHFEFVSRTTYREKLTPEFNDFISEKYGSFYLIPEGGTNDLAIQGCEEILTASDQEFDYICVAVGTGGTIAGISNSALPHQKVLGFPALKGAFIYDDICKFAKNKNFELIQDFHFGGYAKISEELVLFLNASFENNQIPLDPVYTGKLFYGILKLIGENYFPDGSKILAIHTGGLQGIAGMNQKLERLNLLKINFNG